MDEEYAQSLIDWMDEDCGDGESYRDWYASQTAAKKGSETNAGSGPHGPPPPPPEG